MALGRGRTKLAESMFLQNYKSYAFINVSYQTEEHQEKKSVHSCRRGLCSDPLPSYTKNEPRVKINTFHIDMLDI